MRSDFSLDIFDTIYTNYMVLQELYDPKYEVICKEPTTK